MDVLNRLNRYVKINKKINKRKIDLLVIRLTKNNIFGESHPCYHCIQSLINSSVNLRYIYYSTHNGTIKRKKVSDLINSPLHVSSGFRRRGGVTRINQHLLSKIK